MEGRTLSGSVQRPGAVPGCLGVVSEADGALGLYSLSLPR
jgi:hypothetical protein